MDITNMKETGEVKKIIPKYDGVLRSHRVDVPECIRRCTGIQLFGRRLKSFAFSTDVAIIRNINADALIAVYPFTPQPVITNAILAVAEMPVLAGVGGGTTGGPRVIDIAQNAEFMGAAGVVVNAPTKNEIVEKLKEKLDIPVVVTVVSIHEDIDARISAGADIFNVSGSVENPAIIRKIREKYPNMPILATGGPTDETRLATIEAGANAITYTPPSNGELFAILMRKYREIKAQE
ncbi:MAG: hydrolase [Oscillospiraceae bacterium]|nr:hydrolase [Oscillospiraceae bacterium]